MRAFAHTRTHAQKSHHGARFLLRLVQDSVAKVKRAVKLDRRVADEAALDSLLAVRRAEGLAAARLAGEDVDAAAGASAMAAGKGEAEEPPSASPAKSRKGRARVTVAAAASSEDGGSSPRRARCTSRSPCGRVKRDEEEKASPGLDADAEKACAPSSPPPPPPPAASRAAGSRSRIRPRDEVPALERSLSQVKLEARTVSALPTLPVARNKRGRSSAPARSEVVDLSGD